MSHLAKKLRFIFVGIAATATYFVFLNLFVWYAGLGSAPASALAYALGIVVSYSGHRVVTFCSSAKPSAREFAKFLTSALIGLLTSYVVVKITVENLGLDHTVGAVVVTMLVAILSYLLMDRWVFAGKSVSGN